MPKDNEQEGFDHKGKKAEHMAQRYQAHGSFRKLADSGEFGVSKSQAQRIIAAHKRDKSEKK